MSNYTIKYREEKFDTLLKELQENRYAKYVVNIDSADYFAEVDIRIEGSYIFFDCNEEPNRVRSVGFKKYYDVLECDENVSINLDYIVANNLSEMLLYHELKII